jgi:hypothetical protein
MFCLEKGRKARYIRSVSKKGTHRAEQPKNAFLTTTILVETSFRGPGTVNTRGTLDWGKGFGRVAESLPRPVPVYTLPATRAG